MFKEKKMPKSLESKLPTYLSFPGKGDSLDQYLHEISKFPLIPHERLVELVREYHNPKTSRKRQYEIVEKITTPNLRFVVSVAKKKKYQNRGVPLEELIAVGNTGLLRAVKTFDPDRGVKFISYAVWWIRQAILKHVNENGGQARTPLNRTSDISKVKLLKNELIDAGLSECAARDAAIGITGVDRELILNADGLSKPIRLNDLAYGGEGTYQVIDKFPYNSTDPTDEDAETTDLSYRIKKALQTLPKRDARILGWYYALNGGNPMTLEQIGEKIGVTRERTRQIKVRALERLKEGEYGRTLRVLCDALE